MSSASRLNESTGTLTAPRRSFGIHQLALGHAALAHRLRLGGELSQHGVALDRDALGLGEARARAPAATRPAHTSNDSGAQRPRGSGN